MNAHDFLALAHKAQTEAIAQISRSADHMQRAYAATRRVLADESRDGAVLPTTELTLDALEASILGLRRAVEIYRVARYHAVVATEAMKVQP